MQWDKFKFKLPLIARVTRNSNAASFTNTLSILTRSGVPLVDAMAIAGDVVSNTWLQAGLVKATQTVSEGVALKTSLEEVGEFPPMMLHMIAAGEQSGELDEMLSREGRVIDSMARMPDAVEGVTAFFERRDAVWSGSVNESADDLLEC